MKLNRSPNRQRSSTKLPAIAGRLAGIACLAGGLTITPLFNLQTGAQTTGSTSPVEGQSPTQNVKPSNRVHGVVRAKKEAKISAQISSRVTEAAFREGRRFRKGEILVAFDCGELESELASARAQQEEMRAELDSARYLRRHGAGSNLEVKIATARANRASANKALVQERLKNCIIKAPFDGSIASIGVQPHEVTSYGQELMQIISSSDPQIELIVPSAWVAWLHTGMQFQFKVDETGTTHAARVERVSTAVNAVSQTIKVFAVFDDATTTALPGMSGSAHFDDVTAELR